MGSHFSNNKRPSNTSGYQGTRFKQSNAGPSRYSTPTQQPGNPAQQPYRTTRTTQSNFNLNGNIQARQYSSPYMNPEPKKKRPNVLAIVAVILVIVLFAGGFAGFTLYHQAKEVKNDAYAIVNSTGTLKDSIKSGDGDALMSVAEDIQTRSDRMHKTTSNILWNLATLVPVYGEDIKTVQCLSSSLDVLSDDVIMPLAENMAGISLSSLFSDGTVNVDVLSNIANTLVNSKTSINEVAEDIAALPDAHIGQLQNALVKAKPLVATANDAVNVASEVAPYLPQMLGANGQTRTYIVVAQNNSEIRATGGFPGSTGLLTVTDGKIELGEFSGITKLNGNETLIPQLITTNPDWPTAAKDFHDLWLDRIGDDADGAIALDPVFLQHLLKLTGGVTLSDGVTIDGNNAAYILLHDVYVNKEVEVQDAYFAEAAGAAAKQIMGNLGNADMSSLIETVKNDSKANRFMVWMANEEEENAIKKLGFGGEISEDPATPELGIFIDDNTWAKMSWYLSVNTEVSPAVENPDGSKTYAVTVRLKNNITEAEAEAIPKYITGYNPDKTSTGSMINGVTFYAPAGGSISDIQVSTGESYTESSYGSIQVWHYQQQIQLNPQEESIITFNVAVSPDAQEDLRVRTTPTAQEVAGWQ